MTNLESHLILERGSHCRVVNPNITQLTNFNTSSFDISNLIYQTVYKCNRCSGAITASSYSKVGCVEEMYPSEISIDENSVWSKSYGNQPIFPIDYKPYVNRKTIIRLIQNSFLP